MPKISEDVIRAVQDAAKIEDVVGDFVTLRRAGVNLTGLCPFHDDKHAGNFIVRPSWISAKDGGNTYKCFACGAKGGAVKFLQEAEHMSFPDAIRYLGKKYCIPVDDVPVNWVPPPPRPVPPPPPDMVMQREWVRELMKADYNRNTFTLWYGRLPWDEQQRRRMKNTLWQYCVGCYGERVVFWQIDHNGIPRAAKMMLYERDGHRHKDKEGERTTGWLYNQEGYRDICQPQKHTVLHPLFGAHLLNRYPEAHVNIVESEKTALVMANYFGDLEHHLWLAVGGLKWLKIESMQPLIDQGRTVWLWPDKDGVSDWQKMANKLGTDKVQVYTRFFDTCWVPEDGDKADAADIAIRMMRQPDFRPRESKGGGGDGTSEEESVGTPTAGSLPLTEEQLEMLGIKEWAVEHPEDPFIDPLEVQDARVRGWRQMLRQRYNFNKTRK